MRNKILLSIVVFLSIALMVVVRFKKTDFSLPSEPPKVEEQSNNKELTIRIKKEDETIEILDLEEYVIGVVAAEVPALFHEEALKAQALASRTFAVYKIEQNKNELYDILTTTANQVYQDKNKLKEKWQEHYEEYYGRIKKAVLETQGEIITYQSNPIEAFFFSMSNGKTENVSSVFSEYLPYLESVDSKEELNLKSMTQTTSITKKDFCEKLNISCDLIIIENIVRTDTNRIDRITINNVTWKGTEFRTLLNLRSTDFDIEIKDNITITTRGYGHGVGMSQYGANEMAKSGSTYEEIIKHYYQNVEISKI